MITPTSRYANATVSTVVDHRGTHQSVEVPAPTDLVFEFTYYMIEAEDRIDVLAHDLLGSGQLWWMLADANPEILDWHNLTPGTIIRNPLVQ